MKPLFVTGIGTDVGKTIVSAVLVQKFKADYWKPIQAGDLHNTDTMKVQQLISNQESVFHPETYRLTQPFSPHKAAALDGVTLSLDNIKPPFTDNRLIIEGAGGLMVPLNDKDLIIDLIAWLDAEVILVSKNYLGSINHTLLSIEALFNRGLTIRSIVFNGDADEYTQNIIAQHTRHEIPFSRVGGMPVVNRPAIAAAAGDLIMNYNR